MHREGRHCGVVGARIVRWMHLLQSAEWCATIVLNSLDGVESIC